MQGRQRRHERASRRAARRWRRSRPSCRCSRSSASPSTGCRSSTTSWSRTSAGRGPRSPRATPISKLVIGPLFGFLAGWVVDRFGSRRLMIVGILLAGLAPIGLGAMTSLAMFYTFYLCNALGYVLGGPLPNQVLLSRWFDAGRGQAMGFAYLGIGIGGALVPLIAHALEVRFGWHAALQLLGVLMIVVALPLIWFVKDAPPSRPRLTRAARRGKPVAAAMRRRGCVDCRVGSRPRIWTDWTFPLLLIGSMCSIGAVGGTMQNLKLFLSLDKAIAQGDVAGVLSLVLVGSIGGRLLMGVLADLFPKKFVMLGIYALVALTVPLLYAAPSLGDAATGRRRVRRRPRRRLHDHPADGRGAVRPGAARAGDGRRPDRRRRRRGAGPDGRRRAPRSLRIRRPRLRPAARARRRRRRSRSRRCRARCSPRASPRPAPPPTPPHRPAACGSRGGSALRRARPRRDCDPGHRCRDAHGGTAVAAGARGLPTIVVTNGDAAVDRSRRLGRAASGVVGESFIVRGEDDGEAVVAQLMRNRTLAFTVRELAPREVRRLRLEPALDRVMVGPVVARERFDGVDLSIDGRPVAAYQTQPAVPLAGDGRARCRTRRLPASAADAGRARRHRRRRARAAGAARPVVGVGRRRASTGARRTSGTSAAAPARSSSKACSRTWSGPVVAGFRARHRAVDRTVRPPLTAETETWEVTAAGARPRRAAPSRPRPDHPPRGRARAPDRGRGRRLRRARAARRRAPGAAAPAWRSSRRRAGRGATPHDRGPAGWRWSAWSAAPTPASPSSITPTTSGIRSRCSWTAASRS